MKGVIQQWQFCHQDHVAFYSGTWRVTYPELYRLACQTGQLFNVNGDQKVLFCLYNSLSLVLCYLGGWLSGKSLIPVNPRLSNHELKDIIDRLQPDCLVIEANRLSDDGSELLLNPCIKSCYVVDGEGCLNKSTFYQMLSACPTSMPTGYTSCATISHHTSGTTGYYKIIKHSLAQIEQYAIARAKDFGYSDHDRLLIVTSLNHAFSFSYQLLPGLVLGLPMVLVARFDENEVLQAIHKHHITSTALLPPMCYQLARFSQAKTRVNSLEYVLVAGDALPGAFQQQFKSVFNTDLYQGIGMTEVFGYAQNTRDSHKMGSAGKILPEIDIKIVNRQGEECQTSQAGEIVLQTPSNPLVSVSAASTTSQLSSDYWFKTGDIGYVDSEGFLWFLGRKKHIIITGGSNVAPLEVEQVIYQDPKILEACVVGKPDEIYGQLVWAFIKTDNNDTYQPSKLISWLKQRMAEYKVPSKIIMLEVLPKNASGKIDRTALQSYAKELNG